MVGAPAGPVRPLAAPNVAVPKPQKQLSYR